MNKEIPQLVKENKAKMIIAGYWVCNWSSRTNKRVTIDSETVLLIPMKMAKNSNAKRMAFLSFVLLVIILSSRLKHYRLIHEKDFPF
jgi:hypothetical protein